MKYKVVEGISTADVAYEIYGRTIEELFVNAAEAVTQTMVDLATVKPSQNLEFRIKNLELEDLLLDFLNEILFYKDSQGLIFCQFETTIRKKYELNATLRGEKIDLKKHKLRCDVKAVTRYLLAIKKDKSLYKTILVLDI